MAFNETASAVRRKEMLSSNEDVPSASIDRRLVRVRRCMSSCSSVAIAPLTDLQVTASQSVKNSVPCSACQVGFRNS